jgi:hypothetical protein
MLWLTETPFMLLANQDDRLLSVLEGLARGDILRSRGELTMQQFQMEISGRDLLSCVILAHCWRRYIW